MAEIRCFVSKAFMEQLRSKLGLASNLQVACEALTALGWVVEEFEKDRVILSTNKDGKDNSRLLVECLKDPTPVAADLAAEETEHVSFSADDMFMERLCRVLGMNSNEETFEAALTVINWAVDEVSRERGRQIVSCTKVTADDPGGKDTERLAMDCLKFAAAHANP